MNNINWAWEHWFNALLVAVFIFFLLRTLYQMRPLTEKEIQRWAAWERKKDLDAYYSFDTEPPAHLKEIYKSDKPFIDPLGSEIQIDIPFQYGPACISYWLKYKKHQWVLAIYCNDKGNFKLVYGNKGENNEKVVCYLSNNQLLGKGRRYSYNTLIVFHNHPMSISSAIGDDDKAIAKDRKLLAEANDWNYIEYLCVRGRFRKFEEFYSSKFKSITQYREDFIDLHPGTALSNLKHRWKKIY